MRMMIKLMILVGCISLSGCDYFGSKTIYLSCKGETNTSQYDRKLKQNIENSYPDDELGVVIRKNIVSLSGNGSTTYPKEMKVCDWKETITFSDDCNKKMYIYSGNETRNLFQDEWNTGDYNQILKTISLVHRVQSFSKDKDNDQPKMYHQTQSVSEMKCREVKDIK